MRLSYLFALTLLLSSCRQSENQVQVFNTGGFVLVDTILKGNKLLNFEEKYSHYPIYFIGSQSDTVKIGNRYKVGHIKWSKDNNIFSCRKYTVNNLKLFVDTSIKTTSTVEYFSENYKTFDSTRNFKSYLLTLQNVSDSSLYLGRTFELYYLTRQVKNKDGQWVSLDKNLSEAELCLTGQPIITLQAKDIIISKCKRYAGSFLTDFRFAFGTKDNVVYSNIFKDFIDEKIIPNKLSDK
jgi:hypothetical protein